MFKIFKKKKKVEEVVEVFDPEKLNTISDKKTEHSGVEADNIERQQVESEHSFNSNATLPEVCESLTAFMNKNGIELDFSSARGLISAMGTTRLVFLKHPNTELVRKFIQVLSEFFFFCNYYENSSTLWKTTTDVLLAYKNGEYKKSNVLNAIMAGKKDPNNILFTTLFNVYPSSFTYFDDFMNYVKNPISSTGVYISSGKGNKGKGQFLEMPKNLWFFMVLSEEFDQPLSKNITDYAMVINLGMREVEPHYDIFGNDKLMSFNQFLRKINVAADEHFLNEDLWKKIDRFEDFMDLKTDFSIGNKAACQLEEYTAAYIACGGEEKDAVDSVLTNKLLPMANSVFDFKEDTEERNTAAFLDKTFGEDNCIYAQKELDRMKSR